MKSYLRCPRQFELKYVRGAAPEFIPVPLAFGIAFHEALAGHYCAIKNDGAAPQLEAVQQMFRDAWEVQTSGPVPLQADEEEGAEANRIDKAMAMLGVFHEHAARSGTVQVVAVEQSFTVDLIDPNTGEVLTDEKLTGVIDLVLAEGKHHCLVEHKTSARKYTIDQFRFDFQPAAYAYAAGHMGLGEVGLRYQVVTKTKVPVVQVEDVLRDAGDQADFLVTAIGVLRAIDVGAFYPIRGWACRSCPHRSACSSTGGQR